MVSCLQGTQLRIMPISPPPKGFLVIYAIQQDFVLPVEVHNVIFLRARVAMICNEGFEIMDLSESQSVVLGFTPDPLLTCNEQ